MEQGPETAAFMQDGPVMKTDGTSWLAEESVSTPAGTFRASHFLQRRSDGTTVDFWLSRDVVPIGLVKLREVSPTQRESTTELLRAGVGAAPKITATPVPYDRDVMMRQLLAAVREPPPLR
jgi:hypothetical protein